MRPQAESTARSILAVLEPGHDDATIARAVARARVSRANLTLACVWRPSRLLAFAPFCGFDPTRLRQAEQRSVSAWLRDRVARLPDDISVRTFVVEGRPVARLADELGRRQHDELVIAGALTRRELARVSAVIPDLRIVRVSAPPSSRGARATAGQGAAVSKHREDSASRARQRGARQARSNRYEVR